jgi:hypothetical protein
MFTAGSDPGNSTPQKRIAGDSLDFISKTRFKEQKYRLCRPRLRAHATS